MMNYPRGVVAILVLFIGAAQCQWNFPTSWGGWPDWFPPATLSTVASPSLTSSSFSSVVPSTTSGSSTSFPSSSSTSLPAPSSSSSTHRSTSTTSKSSSPSHSPSSTPAPSTTPTTPAGTGSSSAITLQPSASSITVTKGKVSIHNRCLFPVFVAQVLGGNSSQAQGFAPQEIGIGSTLTYPNYEILADNGGAGGGVSLKISIVNDLAAGGPWGGLPIAQLEYTSDPSWQVVSYDMSMVDCVTGIDPVNCPFFAQGWSLQVNEGNCPERSCAAGDTTCTEEYLWTNDNDAVRSCGYLTPDLPAPLDLFLCVP